jgi:hypothetical protein
MQTLTSPQKSHKEGFLSCLGKGFLQKQWHVHVIGNCTLKHSYTGKQLCITVLQVKNVILNLFTGKIADYHFKKDIMEEEMVFQKTTMNY